VGRGIGQTETEAAIELWQQVKGRKAHRHGPPPVLSDGWGGHREALVQVYGRVPEYPGLGRPPTHKQQQTNWHYTQRVKHRDGTGHLTGIQVRVIYGDETTLARIGDHTVHVERTNLTSRHMNGRLVRKTLGFSKRVVLLRASCSWEDVTYNLTRSVKTLRLEVNTDSQRWLRCSPAMAAELTDHIWSIREVLTVVPIPTHSL
jgi:hypothetical protein